MAKIKEYSLKKKVIQLSIITVMFGSSVIIFYLNFVKKSEAPQSPDVFEQMLLTGVSQEEELSTADLGEVLKDKKFKELEDKDLIEAVAADKIGRDNPFLKIDFGEKEE